MCCDMISVCDRSCLGKTIFSSMKYIKSYLRNNINIRIFAVDPDDREH